MKKTLKVLAALLAACLLAGLLGGCRGSGKVYAALAGTYESADGERLALSERKRFSQDMDGVIESGSYEADGERIKLTFEDGSFVEYDYLLNRGALILTQDGRSTAFARTGDYEPLFPRRAEEPSPEPEVTETAEPGQREERVNVTGTWILYGDLNPDVPFPESVGRYGAILYFKANGQMFGYYGDKWKSGTYSVGENGRVTLHITAGGTGLESTRQSYDETVDAVKRDSGETNIVTAEDGEKLIWSRTDRSDPAIPALEEIYPKPADVTGTWILYGDLNPGVQFPESVARYGAILYFKAGGQMFGYYGDKWKSGTYSVGDDGRVTLHITARGTRLESTPQSYDETVDTVKKSSGKTNLVTAENGEKLTWSRTDTSDPAIPALEKIYPKPADLTGTWILYGDLNPDVRFPESVERYGAVLFFKADGQAFYYYGDQWKSGTYSVGDDGRVTLHITAQGTGPESTPQSYDETMDAVQGADGETRIRSGSAGVSLTWSRSGTGDPKIPTPEELFPRADPELYRQIEEALNSDRANVLLLAEYSTPAEMPLYIAARGLSRFLSDDSAVRAELVEKGEDYFDNAAVAGLTSAELDSGLKTAFGYGLNDLDWNFDGLKYLPKNDVYYYWTQSPYHNPCKVLNARQSGDVYTVVYTGTDGQDFRYHSGGADENGLFPLNASAPSMTLTLRKQADGQYTIVSNVHNDS